MASLGEGSVLIGGADGSSATSARVVTRPRSAVAVAVALNVLGLVLLWVGYMGFGTGDGWPQYWIDGTPIAAQASVGMGAAAILALTPLLQLAIARRRTGSHRARMMLTCALAFAFASAGVAVWGLAFAAQISHYASY
jgi:hypothetical protein